MRALEQTEEATIAGEEGVSSRVSEGPRAPAPRLDKGEALGRYLILRELGAGAMGKVYLGYDPELDRKVALKMLRGPADEARRRALLREAQVMAKLRHENVVAVHDVGEHEGRIYVAMEFVEGRTLTAWLAAKPRGWREVLQLFMQAGAGLVAAHGQELIHRDFKPDNVMVARRRQVRVMDFGLARPSAEGSGVFDAELESVSGSGSVLTEATDGRLAGTPAYMAPEQVRIEELSPAADQFAFCVSLWQGVCGERPFAGRSLAEIYTNTSTGQLRPVPAGVRMPGWLERVLRRGLAPRPEQRWPSMQALLDALERGRGRWRWQLGLAGVGALALGLGLFIAHAREQRARAAACEAEGAVIDAIWDAQARAQLEGGLMATGVGFARSSVDTIVPLFDAYREQWRAGRTQACTRASVTLEWDAELLERARWCLEDRRLQFGATVEQISMLDRAGARRAVRLASYLDPVEVCLDPELLRRLPLPPAELREGLLTVRGRLDASDRLRHGGHYEQALAEASAAREQAEALGWPPLLARARFIEGRCSMLSRELALAERQLLDAYFGALEAGAVDVAFRSARSLAISVGRQARHREALVWLRHAQALAVELDDPLGLDEAEHDYLQIELYAGLGDYEAALEAGERTMAMRAAVLGEAHPLTAAVTRNMGKVQLEAGRPAEALELFESSTPIWVDAVGREHPYVAELAWLRSRALLELGRPEQALGEIEDSLDIYGALRGDAHPGNAKLYAHMGAVLSALERLEPAEQAYAQARALGWTAPE